MKRLDTLNRALLGKWSWRLMEEEGRWQTFEVLLVWESRKQSGWTGSQWAMGCCL